MLKIEKRPALYRTWLANAGVCVSEKRLASGIVWGDHEIVLGELVEWPGRHIERIGF